MVRDWTLGSALVGSKAWLLRRPLFGPGQVKMQAIGAQFYYFVPLDFLMQGPQGAIDKR